jgi:hypothetical protein
VGSSHQLPRRADASGAFVENSGAKPRRENEWTMFIEDYYKFVMGQVSEDCGGNPTSLEL